MQNPNTIAFTYDTTHAGVYAAQTVSGAVWYYSAYQAYAQGHRWQPPALDGLDVTTLPYAYSTLPPAIAAHAQHFTNDVDWG